MVCIAFTFTFTKHTTFIEKLNPLNLVQVLGNGKEISEYVGVGDRFGTNANRTVALS
jgi:hypothetical protein